MQRKASSKRKSRAGMDGSAARSQPSLPGIRLLSTDLDGTLLGNPEATERFRRIWKRIPTPSQPLLVYNSGRMISDILQLIKEGALDRPDYLIGGVGTEIFNARNNKPLEEFNRLFSNDWNLELVEKIVGDFPGVERQPPEFLHPYKSSWYLHRATPEAIRELEKRLSETGLDVNVIYSSQRDLDVLPSRANKGNALAWLCKQLHITLDQVLVTGDTANDTSMFRLPGVKGIVVENAQPQLYENIVELPVFRATRVLADGVIEGLSHYGVISQVEESYSRKAPMDSDTTRIPPFFNIGTQTPVGESEMAVIREGYKMALEALHRNITPAGFSACSLNDNETTGTDENYRSVWARDGAITIISVIDIESPEIRKAAHRTLCTLMDHLSPTGQIPTNVRIDYEEPDYSGVGGICSVDSGLWVIVAFYHYIRITQDFDMLERYAPRLQRAMDWLSAHDSNNDGLLEIPEAGDWTDLFGRSYNVLYDEVLWYRANVCFGRLMEFRQKYKKAAEYLSRSQFIRGEILGKFWPSTRMRPEDRAKFSFADQQLSIGDAQFLISQVSPFSFSWRCDVFGNVLAFLTNVLDVERARTAFRFMWGVGVNEPWPVTNLYPPVHSGDPDWRPYYTVNLLNLPHHYHNGGIWPFIGGMWVRFIYRLGLGDLALRELYRLAELNRLGKETEWEFNEWMHGKTGRPMGKRYQAWSAGAYLRACHELGVTGD